MTLGLRQPPPEHGIVGITLSQNLKMDARIARMRSTKNGDYQIFRELKLYI